jgi:hypothetical protein
MIHRCQGGTCHQTESLYPRHVVLCVCLWITLCVVYAGDRNRVEDRVDRLRLCVAYVSGACWPGSCVYACPSNRSVNDTGGVRLTDTPGRGVQGHEMGHFKHVAHPPCGSRHRLGGLAHDRALRCHCGQLCENLTTEGERVSPNVLAQACKGMTRGASCVLHRAYTRTAAAASAKDYSGAALSLHHWQAFYWAAVVTSRSKTLGCCGAAKRKRERRNLGLYAGLTERPSFKRGFLESSRVVNVPHWTIRKLELHVGVGRRARTWDEG